MKSKQTSLSAVVLVFLTMGSSIVFSDGAFANNIGKDILVRFQYPQNTLTEANDTLFDIGVDSAIKKELVLPDQGVVRLQFANEVEAARAYSQLQASPYVLNVQKNNLYKKQVIYRFNQKQAIEENRGRTSTNLFFRNLANLSSVPEVLLPPTSAAAGADPLTGNDWGINKINMPSLGTNLVNSSILTAVIDTGIDYNHEDLIGSMWRDPNNPKEVGYDFAHNHNKPYDVVHFDLEGCMKDIMCLFGIGQEKFLVNPGHGTHCAGHVGGTVNNTIGIQSSGPGAKVMGLKFFYDFGDPNAGQGDDVGAIKSIDYAIKHGVKVISASWGGEMDAVEANKSELKTAIVRAQQAGVLFVVAAGNSKKDNDTDAKPGFPAAYDLDNILTVVATDSNDGLADFSSYGAKSAHVGAPGVKILSTIVGSKYSDTVGKLMTQEIGWDGTSMATPYVAGAAATVWAAHPTENYKQIKERLIRSARKVSGLQGKTVSGGVIDVKAAINLAL